MAGLPGAFAPAGVQAQAPTQMGTNMPQPRQPDAVDRLRAKLLQQMFGRIAPIPDDVATILAGERPKTFEEVLREAEITAQRKGQIEIQQAIQKLKAEIDLEQTPRFVPGAPGAIQPHTFGMGENRLSFGPAALRPTPPQPAALGGWESPLETRARQTAKPAAAPDMEKRAADIAAIKALAGQRGAATRALETLTPPREKAITGGTATAAKRVNVGAVEALIRSHQSALSNLRESAPLGLEAAVPTKKQQQAIDEWKKKVTKEESEIVRLYSLLESQVDLPAETTGNAGTSDNMGQIEKLLQVYEKLNQ